tara:strand:+ start:7421 stop:8272 length:852 start_codon:yes stop_codon:yes gene_type:complete
MTREAAIATISPSLFIVGAPVRHTDPPDVIKQANWSFANRPALHGAQTVADEGWETGAPLCHAIGFRVAATGFVGVIQFPMYIEPETTTIRCGAECNMGASDTGDVKFTIGATSVTLSTFAVGQNGTEVLASITAANAGRGWVTCTIEIDRLAGSGTAELLRYRVQSLAETAFPAPLIEGDTEVMYLRTGVASTPYTVVGEQQILHVTHTATAAVTVNLRAAATAGDGAWIKVVDAGNNAATNNITIDGNGAETINGSATYVMNADRETVEIYCDGSNWFVAP